MKYTVKSGDTLSAIAKKHNTTVEAIRKANSKLIKNVNVISIGWVLTIPNSSESSETDYEAIGKAVSECLKDIQNLTSYKKLMLLL